jgi:hypothetical protein
MKMIEHKITLEQAIEQLIEIRNRFRNGMSLPNTKEETGIVFSIKEESDRYTLVVGKEAANDLLTLHK